MKKAFLLIICLFPFVLFAGNTKLDKAKEAQVKTWVKKQQLEFVENKGQLKNTEGKPADNVLFKASTKGCDIYITDKGLTYVFTKITNYELRITNYGRGR